LHMDAFKSAATGMDLPSLQEALAQMDGEDHGAES